MERRSTSATFPPAATSVAAARRFVRRTLNEWDLTQVADDALLATSELATNAVTYAGTEFEVRCTLEDGGVRIEVLDRHPARHIAMPEIEATSGRGLPSVDRLASSWGITYNGLTKGVWFRLDRPGARTGERPAAPALSVPSLAIDDTAGLSLPSDRVLDLRPGEESLDGAVETVRDMLSADGVAVLLTDRGGDLVLGASTGRIPDPPLARLTVASLGPHARVGAPWTTDDPTDPVAAALAARSLVAAPLQVQGRLTGVLVAVAGERGRFDEAVGKRLGRIAEEMALSMERARISELERSWRGWLSFVAEASDLLAGTLDQERTMALVAQLVVPRLATWCAVYTVDETKTARPAYVWHADETRADGLRELLTAAPQPPLDSSGAWNGHTAAPGDARAAAGSTADDLAYAFPLIARGRRMGVLVIGRPAGDRFPQSAIDLAEELSRRAALAIDNARLYTAQTATSRALQRSLLPPGIPKIPGLEVEVVYQPAGEGSEVGGDFYDVFECGADPTGAVPAARWRFAIGDVCGTGPEAAAVTGLARHALRILAAEDMPVPDVLARLNRLILAEGPRARLLTLLHGEITRRPGRDGVRIDLVSAGHPLPLVLDPDGGVHEAAEAQPLLGAFDDVEFTAQTMELRRGQVMLCVTDGVTERRSGDRLLGDGRGLENLLSGCRGLSAGAVAARIQRAVRDFGPEPSNDDVALIVLRAS
nr:SpoIIE family protein phosphatase [Thermomonospora catenispora]